ncbi:UDP-glycosyltransferase 89A2-like [Primulina tabacum]|uniref:UDP-glycosyltransferase 89A2-like n=1 Tax=Primulina tabacum TaxID=48773 RepID=UPI003F59880F
MEKTTCSKNGAHVLVFPYPAQGHMLPLLDLTYQLSLRNLSITILITPGNLPILTPLLTANPSIQTLILPFPNSPLIPPGVENIKDLGDRGNIPMASALRKLEEPIIQWFESHCDPPVAILSDFFLGWTHNTASKLNIARVGFYTSGAIVAVILDRLWEDLEALKPGFEVKLQDLPGSPCLAWEELPSLVRLYKEQDVPDPSFEVFKDSTMANTLSWAVVFNSFVALEGEFLNYLSEKMGNPRVYSVGPLHLLGPPKNLGDGPISGDDVLSWLDECEDGSVLYVCFGSQKFFKKAQMEALATGLERSGVKFVWAVKQVTAQQLADGFGSVPEGFEDRLAGRGFVINGWAPQTAILSHRAVGGFLSHCGWNSTIEAVASGVMILCWPMEADQYVDDKLMVDYKKAAVPVCKGNYTVPDPDELARKITESMSRDVVERIKAKELRDKAVEAVKVGGSSNKDLDLLVQELAKLKGQNV